MDRTTLEQLLIDRSLGELTPEVVALLDAYLTANPSDAATAQDMDAMIERARIAMQRPAIPTEAALPPFPSARLARTLDTPRGSSMLLRLRPVAMAAAIVLAFFLGTRTSNTPTDATLQPAQVALAEHSACDVDSSSFWSVDKYVAARAERPAETKKTLAWTTPLAWPRLGDVQ